MPELDEAPLVLYHDGSDRAKAYRRLMRISGLDYTVRRTAGKICLVAYGITYCADDNGQDGILFYVAVESPNKQLPIFEPVFAELKKIQQKISVGHRQAQERKASGDPKPPRSRSTKSMTSKGSREEVDPRISRSLAHQAARDQESEPSEDDRWWQGIARL